MEIHPVALLKPPLTWTQCDNAIHVSIDLVPCAEHYYHKARPQTFCGVQGKPYRLGRHGITASRSCLTASCSSRHSFAGPSSRVLRRHISNSIHFHPVPGFVRQSPPEMHLGWTTPPSCRKKDRPPLPEACMLAHATNLTSITLQCMHGHSLC